MKKEVAEKDGTMRGIIKINSRGTGYFPQTDSEEDIEIQTHFLKTALSGDEVEIAVRPEIIDERKQGEVVKVIKRAKTEFVGVAEQSNGVFFLVPDDRKLYRDIFIHPSKSKGLKSGQKALVKIVGWKDPMKNPEGEVIKILGNKGEHNVEMEAIILEKGFETSFPPEVEKEAEEISRKEESARAGEIKNRKDFRKTTTFTIDPVDAKDFDDAISFKELPHGDYEIGVHIADVSHYVREGSLLDKEAKKRGLSVYLVDRTVPMLPEILSNDLCSLNPREDKLAFGAVFIVDKNGLVKERWFGKTIINSDNRFSYEDAQEVLNKKQGDFHHELSTLNLLAKILSAEKFKKGAIDFEAEEVKFVLDSNGVPIKVYKKERLDTHKLVEEFMLLANREVAEFIFNAHKKTKNGSFIYRIHDVPDSDRISDLSTFLKALGYDLPVKDGRVSSREINNLLKQVEGKSEESLIKTAMIRSMAKAVYSTKNIGHFGLAFEYYTHFTSPIRRYPDLIVHRLLYRHLINGPIFDNEFVKYEKMALDSSEKEKDAAEAERASIKFKQVEYMQKHVGETFDGIIAGVTEWGIYVEEENTKCEGMVRLKDIGNDFYELDKKTYSIVGTRTKKKYSLGDKVKFKVMAADLDRKMLDYALV